MAISRRRPIELYSTVTTSQQHPISLRSIKDDLDVSLGNELIAYSWLTLSMHSIQRLAS